MPEEKYVLNCPHCGRVEGFFFTGLEDDEAPPDSDSEIQQQVVRTDCGPAVRVRCPRCGRWVKSDRVGPA